MENTLKKQLDEHNTKQNILIVAIESLNRKIKTVLMFVTLKKRHPIQTKIQKYLVRLHLF